MPIKIDPIIVEAKEKRKQKGITQMKLSHMTGFHHIQLNRWETGKHHPSIWSTGIYLFALGYKLKIVPINED